MTKNIIDFGQAEQKAKQRDLEIEKQKFIEEHNGVDQAEVEKAFKILSKVTGGKEIYIGTKKSPQSKVRFAQILQDNLKHLNKNDYLTGQEKVFLLDIIPLVSFRSNALVFDIKEKSPVPVNITQLAERLNRGRNKTSEIVNALVKKGLIAKAESGMTGNNAKAYSLFINPHIIFAGDKDNVPEHLQLMFHKSMRMSVLKDFPNKLF